MPSRNFRQKHTDTLWERLVPLTRGLAGQDRRAKQVIPRVAVIEYHRAEGEVTMLYFTLPDGVGRNPGIRAIDDWTQRKEDNKEKTRRGMLFDKKL